MRFSRQHRVALVRHGGGALLAGWKVLLGLEHLGALQVADLRSPAARCRATTASAAKNIGVAVARDDLRRDGLGRQAELRGDVGLDPRIDVGEGADGAGDGAGRDLGPRRDQALARRGRTRHRPGPASGRRWSARHGCHGCGRCVGVSVLEGARFSAASRASTSAISRSAARVELHREKQVSSTSEEVMPWCTKRASGPTISARWVRKAMTSCRVIALDLVDAGDVEDRILSLSQILGGGLLRHDAQLGQASVGMRLDLEPDAEARLRSRWAISLRV